MDKKRLAVILILILILGTTTGVGLYLLIKGPKEQSQSITEAAHDLPPESTEETPADAPAAAPMPEPEQPATNYPVVLTNQQASAIDVVVNKKHQLPSNYAPELEAVGLAGNGTPQLRPEASNALKDLFTAGNTAGFNLFIISSYRSYQNQQSTYNGYVQQYGQAEADTFSARPGYSEHQTGLAADIGLVSGQCALDECFGTTPAGTWLANNAANFGFIIRYPEGKDAITGYHYEPWHVRYLGNDLAMAVHASGKTYEEYTGIEGGGY